MARKLKGSIIIPAGLQVWEHELKTAEALAQTGYVVEFVAVSTHYKIKSADVIIDGVLYEIKSPVASKLSAVERNLKRAYHQSVNIIFDSRRIKYLPDKSIQKELVKQFVLTKNIKSILFVNLKQEVILAVCAYMYYTMIYTSTSCTISPKINKRNTIYA